VLHGDGRAVGVMRSLGFDGTNTVTCLDTALAAMTDATGLSVSLAKP
jgi:hypothetical protein